MACDCIRKRRYSQQEARARVCARCARVLCFAKEMKKDIVEIGPMTQKTIWAKAYGAGGNAFFEPFTAAKTPTFAKTGSGQTYVVLYPG